MAWTCKDIGMVAFEGYASPTEKGALEASCPKAAVGSIGGLPFTGIDLGFGLLAAVLLVLVGLTMRRIARRG